MSNPTLTERGADVLRSMYKHLGITASPTVTARVLNFGNPCEWAPVMQPKDGEKCAVVPKFTAAKVQIVLNVLCLNGFVEKKRLRKHRHGYFLTEAGIDAIRSHDAGRE